MPPAPGTQKKGGFVPRAWRVTIVGSLPVSSPRRISASCSMVGAWNRVARGRSRPIRSSMRTINLIASNEWPPRAKKSCRMSTCGTSNTSSQMRVSSSSTASRGVALSSRVMTSGSGRPRRLILPEGVKGICSRAHEGGGHHVIGQLLSDKGFEITLVQRLPAFSHEVGDDPFVLTHIDGDDSSAFDVRMRGEDSFDFTKLDAMPAHFDLVIDAAEELDSSVVAIVGEIATVVKPGARSLAEGVGNEFFGGERRPPVIPPARSSAADVQLTWYTHRCRISVLIENVDLFVGQRPANGGCEEGVPCPGPVRPGGR